MDTIEIKEYHHYDQTEILALYKSVGWSIYYDRPELLKRAFAASLDILGAYDRGRLIGLLRTVGDGATVVFIQDVLLHPEYQRRGIGRRLIACLMARYPHIRQMHLLTDDLPETVGFYTAVGFSPVDKVHYRAFTRV